MSPYKTNNENKNSKNSRNFSKFYTGIQKAKEGEGKFHRMFDRIASFCMLLSGNQYQLPHQGKEFAIIYQGSLKDGCSFPRSFIKTKDGTPLQIELDRAHFIGEIAQENRGNLEEIAGTPRAKVLNNEMVKQFFLDYYQTIYEDGIHGEYLNSERVRQDIFHRSRITGKHNECIESIIVLALADENASIIVPEGAERDPSANVAHKVSINIYSESLPVTFHMDIVSLLQLAFWPESAREWVKDGKWPSKEDRKQIIHQHKCSLVPITSGDETAQTEWRYSFVDIECHLMSLLFQADDNHCYLIYFLFKALYYRFVKSKYDSEKDVVSSYMIKTTLLLVSEDHQPEHDCWKDPRVGLAILLEKLYACLCDRNLPHYFLPKVNILEKVLDYGGESLCSGLSEQVGDIIKNIDAHLDDIYSDFDGITTKGATWAFKFCDFLEVFFDTMLSNALMFLMYDDSLFEKYNELANSKGITPLDSKFKTAFKTLCMEIKRIFIHK